MWSGAVPAPDSGAATTEETSEWNLSVRGEHPYQRADRNFQELLQELRVMQTGIQVLFALLLTVSFTGEFSTADAFERVVYVITLMCCAVATALFTAPVAFHRRLFQRGHKAEVVMVAHRLLRAGMLVLLVTVVGSLLLVVDHAVGLVLGILVSSVVGVVFVLLWFVLPARSRAALPPDPAGPPAPPQPG